MMDEVEASGTKIDCKKLSKLLGVPVVPIVARTGKGVDELMKEAQNIALSNVQDTNLEIFSPQIKNYIEEIVCLISENENQGQDKNSNSYEMWQAIKILEEDEDAVVASLVATIEFNKETGKNARLKSIKRIDD